MFSNQEVSRTLARERVGDQVFGVGFRLRIGTEKALHRMKYGGFPNAAQQLGRWMGKQWRAPSAASVLVLRIGGVGCDEDSIHRRRWRMDYHRFGD